MGTYKKLFSAPHIKRLELLTLIGRLQLGAGGLSVTLFIVSQTKSFVIAGLVASSFSICAAFSSPLKGRWIDRYGAKIVLLPMSILNVGVYLGLIAIAHLTHNAIAFCLVGGLMGFTVSNLTTYMRAIWLRVHPNDPALQQSAMAFESTMSPIMFMIGPMIVSGLIRLSSPSAALVFVALTSLIGSLGMAFSPLSMAPAVKEKFNHSPTKAILSSPGMPIALCINASTNLTSGIMQIALPAFAVMHGSKSNAGLLFSMLAVSSLVGGLSYGSRKWERSSREHLPFILAFYSLALIPLFFVHSMALILPLLLVVGFFGAPLGACQTQAVADSTSHEIANEALSWNTTIGQLAASLGNALAGLLIASWSVNGSFLFLALPVGLAAAFLIIFRGRILPPRLDEVAASTL